MKKTIIKIIVGIFIFLGGIICSQNVCKASNLDLFKGQYTQNEIFEVSPQSNYDIAGEIRKVSKSVSDNGKLLIHIPSGTFILNNLFIDVSSNIAIVAENNTIIKSTETAERIIRIADSENFLIYGGTWNADNKSLNGIEISNVKNIKIENVIVQNTKKHGIVFYKDSTASLNNVKVMNNNECGMYIQNSNATINNSEISNSNSSGISASNAKTLKIDNVTVQKATKYGMVFYDGTNANINNVRVKNNKDYGIYSQNSTATIENSEITNNDCSGIACAKANAKVYVKNNRINNNGKNARKTDEGYLGHGVAIQDGAYGEISNGNIINNNKVCGISVSSSNECGTSKAYITNNKIYNNGRHGIGARKITEMTVNGNEIYGNLYDGIMIADRSTATINNNHSIRENAEFGLSVGNDSIATINGNNISNNTDSNITVHDNNPILNITNNNTINGSKNNNGINVTGSATLNITGSNNVISSNAHHGISVTSKNVKLNLTGKNNTIKKNKGAGIYVEKSKDIKLTGKTTVKENKTSGIIIYGAKVTAKNLTIKNNSQYGVAVRQKGNLTITKSTIKSNKDYGIHVVDKGTSAKIENNTITYNKDVGINVDKKAKVSSIYKNELKKNGEKAIRICNSAEVKKIKKNNIKKHSKYGIYIKKAKAKTITGNKFSSINKKYQIYKA